MGENLSSSRSTLPSSAATEKDMHEPNAEMSLKSNYMDCFYVSPSIQQDSPMFKD